VKKLPPLSKLHSRELIPLTPFSWEEKGKVPLFVREGFRVS